jgi:hypothetical protein
MKERENAGREAEAGRTHERTKRGTAEVVVEIPKNAKWRKHIREMQKRGKRGEQRGKNGDLQW